MKVFTPFFLLFLKTTLSQTDCEFRFGENDIFFYNLSHHYDLFGTIGPIDADGIDSDYQIRLSVCSNGDEYKCENIQNDEFASAPVTRSFDRCEFVAGRWDDQSEVHLIDEKLPGKGVEMVMYGDGCTGDDGNPTTAMTTVDFVCDMSAVGDTFYATNSNWRCDWDLTVPSKWACGRNCYKHSDCDQGDYCNIDGACFPTQQCFVYHDPVHGEDCTPHDGAFVCAGHEDCMTNQWCDSTGICQDYCTDCMNVGDSTWGGCSYCAERTCTVQEDCEVGYCDVNGWCWEPVEDCSYFNDPIPGTSCPTASKRVPRRKQNKANLDKNTLRARTLKIRPEACVGIKALPNVIGSGGDEQGDDTQINRACEVWDSNWWCHTQMHTYVEVDLVREYPVHSIGVNSANDMYYPMFLEVSDGEPGAWNSLLYSEYLIQQKNTFELDTITTNRYWRVDFNISLSYAICVNDLDVFYLRDFNLLEVEEEEEV